MRSTALFLSLLLLSSCVYQQVQPIEPLTEEDIIRMSKEGTPPEKIIERIRDSHTIYIMDTTDVLRLHELGVPNEVVDYMLNTRIRALERQAHYPYSYSYGPYWHPYPVHFGFMWHGW
jgi:hypothetical protein